MTDSAQTTLGDYLRILKRSRWLILLITLLCAAVAIAYTQIATPSYEASAQLTVRDPAQDLGLAGQSAGTTQLPLQLASAHAPEVTRSEVLREVKSELGLEESIEDIRSLVTVDVDPNAYTVQITAEDSDAEDAARIANAFAAADVKLTTEEERAKYAASYERLADRLRSDLEEEGGDPTQAAIYATRVSGLQALSENARPVEVSSQAQVPSSASSPKPLRDVGAATLIGVLLGIGVAYARSLLDRRLRDQAAVEQVFDQPVLARLRGDVFGHTGSMRDMDVPELGALDPIDGESFRMLRENVRYLAVDRDLRTIVVTSAIPEEGKSTVAACLSMAYASAGSRTLLVECDLRRRVLAGRFGIAEYPGLADYLIGRAEPRDVLQSIPSPTPGMNGSDPHVLTCVAAGSAPPRPADLLSSARFADFVEKVSKVYDRVVIDCPPLLPVADTLEIVPHADAVLMCVRLDRTTLDQAEAARDALGRLPSRPIGLVLTDIRETDTGYYGSYYAYGRELAATTGETPRVPTH